MCSYKTERSANVYRKSIQDSIDYIENNLKSEFTVQELSENAGFSLFHYYRLFRGAVGIPVMQYIVRRKLLHAIYEISEGNKMIDAALQYGFETYAGFYRAFVREFGYAPAQFLKTYKVRKPYRINIFEEEHIMVTHKKIKEVLQHWGLENEKVADILYEGTGNRNENAYYVGTDFVVKYSPNLGRLKNNMGIAKELERVGLFAAIPVKTLGDEEYVTDGELYYCLSKRLEGKQLQPESMYLDDYITKARYVGEVIGHLSKALSNINVLVDDTNTYDTVVNWAIPQIKRKLNIPEAFLRNYVEVFGDLYNKLPRQVIHRDPNPGNIIFADDKWGFIDFELSEKNIRIYDPCYAATAILSESFTEENESKLKKWIDIYKNIIYGYDDVVKLTEDEKKAIPYVVLSNQLVAVSWFSEKEKYREIYEVNKKMTEWIVERFESLAIQ